MMRIAAENRPSPETAFPFAELRMGSLARYITVTLDRVIFYSLLALFVVLAAPYGAVEAWWEAIFECAVFGLGALWMVEGLLRGSWRLGDVRVFAPLLALAVFAWWQSWSWQGTATIAGIESRWWAAISADPHETQRFVVKLLALLLTAVLLQSHLTTRRRFRALINVLILIGVGSAIFGVVRQTAQHSEGFLLAYLLPGEGYGQFINRNHFAFLMEMTFGLALGLVVGGGARRDRLLIYVAALIPLWTGLVLSNSRGGIGSLLSQILFVALMFGFVRCYSTTEESEGWSARLARIGRSAAARLALVCCLALSMAVGIVWMGGDPLANRMETLAEDLRLNGQSERSGESRVEIWQATWQLIKAHPVTGAGFGAYSVAIPEHHDSSGEMVPREAHNDYLELLANGGIIAGLIGVWFLIALIRRVREEFRSRDVFRRAVCFGAMVGIFGVATHSLVDFGLHITFNAIVFLALVVIATADWNAANQEESHP